MRLYILCLFSLCCLWGHLCGLGAVVAAVVAVVSAVAAVAAYDCLIVHLYILPFANSISIFYILFSIVIL
jgi:hypothetical protein